MEVKPGYKQTEVGVIPEDWEVKPVGSMGEVRAGKALAARGPGELRPYLRTKNVFDGKIDTDDILEMPMTDAEFALYRLRRGDVLLNEGQSIELVGRCAMYQGELAQPCAIQNQLVRFRAFAGTPAGFATHLFRRCQATGVFAKIAMQTTSVAHLGVSRFAKLQLAWPPTRAEQEAIAGALSDADALIESQEQLVAKKRQIKHGAMQQLLTGQHRLPGFTGEWEETTLGELTTFLSGGTPSRSKDDYWTGDIPWISAMSLRCFEIWRSDSNVTKEAVVAGSKMAPVGSSLLLVRGSALHNEILCGLVVRPVCFNQDVKALVPKPHVVPRFLTLFIQGNADAILKLVSSAGNTAGVLDTKLLKAFRVNLPEPQEQSAITSVLSDMGAEIEALEVKLAKARQVKQGMMQELLTGKTRLIT